MLTTHTGQFPIGFRRLGSAWQKDLPGLIAWAKDAEIGVIDVADGAVDARAIADAGLKVGSADLKEWPKLMSPDKAARADAVAANLEYVKQSLAGGARVFFACMIPEKPERSRAENFADLVDAMQPLAEGFAKLGAALAIEGWPGRNALCCTPEGYRALFKEVPGKAIGINYDPSHLIRMGIDHIRFLGEFADRVHHVHGKDTEILTDDLYEYGHETPATFAKGHRWGGHAWRYTLPGHGVARWGKILSILKDTGYRGAVCVELEDENFNGTEEGEKRGILGSAQFLSLC